MQLDEILKELLGDAGGGQIYETDRRGGTATSAMAIPSEQGSMTTRTDNSRTVVSWQTNRDGPHKSVQVTKQVVSQPEPNSRVESEVTRRLETTSSKLPYGSTSGRNDDWNDFAADGYSSSHESRRVEARSEKVMNERVISPQRQTFNSRRTPPPAVSSSPSNDAGPLLYSTPYRDDYQASRTSQPYTRTLSDYRNYASDSEDPMSWLEEQRSKLRTKHDGRSSWRVRNAREKQLVAELKSAQTMYSSKRSGGTQSDVEDSGTFEYRRPERFGRNGPSQSVDDELLVDDMTLRSTRRQYDQEVPYNRHPPKSESFHQNYETKKSFFVSGIERPPYTTQQTKYTFSVSPQRIDDGVSPSFYGGTNRPPPAPVRTSAPTSPVVPQRGNSSREAVLRTQSRNWQNNNYNGELS